jgi:hypothetical protein
VASNIKSFEQAFLARVVLPDNRMVYEHTAPRIAQIEIANGGELWPLLPGHHRHRPSPVRPKAPADTLDHVDLSPLGDLHADAGYRGHNAPPDYKFKSKAAPRAGISCPRVMTVIAPVQQIRRQNRKSRSPGRVVLPHTKRAGRLARAARRSHQLKCLRACRPTTPSAFSFS